MFATRSNQLLPLCRLPFAFLLVACLSLTTAPARSQSVGGGEVEVTEQNGQNFSLRIDGGAYLALPVEEARRLFERVRTLELQLEEADKKIDAKDRFIAELEKANETFEKHISLQDALLEQTQGLYEGYRGLYADLKKAGSYDEPLLSFSGGLGAVRDDVGPGDLLPVLVLGLSIKRLSVWGFVNSRQSGLVFGVNYPLRLDLF